MYGQSRQQNIWDSMERIRLGVAEADDYALIQPKPVRYGFRDLLSGLGMILFMIMLGML